MYNDLNFGFLFLTQRLWTGAQLVHLWCSCCPVWILTVVVCEQSWSPWNVTGLHVCLQHLIVQWKIQTTARLHVPDLFLADSVLLFCSKHFHRNRLQKMPVMMTHLLPSARCQFQHVILKFLYRIGNHNSFSSHTWHLIKQDIQWNYCPHVMIGWEKACYREATCFSTWPLSLPLLLHLHNLFKCFTMTDRKHSSYPNRWRGRDVE